MCVQVCVCVCMSERERDSVHSDIDKKKGLCVFVCIRNRKRVCTCMVVMFVNHPGIVLLLMNFVLPDCCVCLVMLKQ